MEYLNVRIDSPEKLIWEGKARSVSSQNSEGPFDILPLHASFITIIENKPIKIVAEDGKVNNFKFERSIIYNRGNIVTIYTNI